MLDLTTLRWTPGDESDWTRVPAERRDVVRSRWLTSQRRADLELIDRDAGLWAEVRNG